LFIHGTEPSEYDNVHRPFRVCRDSGKLATVYCPLDRTEEVVFEIFPKGTEDWVRESGIPQPPPEYCDLHGPHLAASDVAITSPQAYSYVRGLVPIAGNAKPGDFHYFRLQYGEGIDPASWTQIGGDRYDRVDNNVLGNWDTSALDGLYSVKLTVIEHGDRYRETAVLLSVDNISPTIEIEIINPTPKYDENPAIHVIGWDEWASVQAIAEDNTSMDRVEFFLDGSPLGIDTVAPYTRKWTISMSDTIPLDITAPDPAFSPPELLVEGDRIVASTLVTTETSIDFTQIITVGDQITVTNVISHNGQLAVRRHFPGGRGIISDTVGYTETHTIKAIAYDAAGNQMESEEVTIYIVHEREEEEESTPADSDTALLLPREQWLLPPPQTRWRRSFAG
jgi:hypothetical protein